MFGLQPPDGVKTYWGARAIFEKDGKGDPAFSFLYDRQDNEGDPETRLKIKNWLDKEGGLTLLRKELKDKGIQRDNNRLVVVENDKYRLEANPNKSYGYLYMVAYLKEEVNV